MRLSVHILKATILLCIALFLFATAQSAHAQDDPQFSNCDSIPTTDCQIELMNDRFLEPARERWQIQLDEDKPFSPVNVQNQLYPGTVMILVDASWDMRRNIDGKIPLLEEVYGKIEDLNAQLNPEGQQATQDELSKMLWSMFFIGAQDAQTLYSWCELPEISTHCTNGDWRSGASTLTLLFNASVEFKRAFTNPLLEATPFSEPLANAINKFRDQVGPKHIVCFCEGLDAGKQPDVQNTSDLANAQNIRIHVVHMYKDVENGLDATDSLTSLAEKTGGVFVPIEGDVAPIWQAITQELNDYQYTLTLPASKPAKQIAISYKSDDGSLTSVAQTAFPEAITVQEPEEVATPTPTTVAEVPTPTVATVQESEILTPAANISINGQSIDLAIVDPSQRVFIAPNADGIDMRLELDDGRLSIGTIELAGRSWAVDELKTASVSKLFSADKPVLTSTITLNDSANSESIAHSLSLAIEQPESRILEDFKKDENGYVVIPRLKEGETAFVLVPAPRGIDGLTPKALVCEIHRGPQLKANLTDMQCEIPFGAVSEYGNDLFVELTDHWGFEYTGQVPLRLGNRDPLTLEEILRIIMDALSRLPQWLWWMIGAGIASIAMIGAAISLVRNRQKRKADIRPDTDATECSGVGDHFPPTHLPSSQDATARISYVLPVAKLTLEHAPAEDKNTLAPEITIYPNTLKWGIGRDKNKLLVEPEYQNAEPIEISAKSVSRVQARLEFDIDLEGFFLVGDMTPNGTYINRTKLEPIDPYPLQPGDEVQFGKIAYKFEVLEMDLQKAFAEFTSHQTADGLDAEKAVDSDLDPTLR